MNLTLHVWRQDGPDDDGQLRDLRGRRTSATDMSFLEMLDVAQRAADRRRARSRSPSTTTAARASAARAALMINGLAHGPQRGTATCQLHMRSSTTATTIIVEPWRARGVPGHQGPRRRPRGVRPHHRGRRLHHRADRRGARRQPRSRSRRPVADAAMDAAACIGCGACVAACPNGAGHAVHRAPRSRTSTCCRRASPSAASARRGDGRRRWTEYFGSLHQPRRVRGGVPEGDLASTSSP